MTLLSSMFLWALCAGGLGAGGLGCVDDPVLDSRPGDLGADFGASDLGADASPVDMGSARDTGPGDVGVDGGGFADAATPDAGTKSRCERSEDAIRCSHRTELFLTGLSGIEPREVHWQTPAGQAPADGWPAVILFQGSLYSSEFAWLGRRGGLFGEYYQVGTIAELLDRGYTVITPEAHYDGTTFWDTNIAPWNYAWESSSDHQYMLEIFSSIESDTFGAIDEERLYATGISSGGYMTSRMGYSYTERFRALAIHSGSFARCAAALCTVPELPDAHPPTLFLHGGLDSVVPLWTMHLYANELEDMGIEERRVVVDAGLHTWLEPAPAEIADWFDAH